MKWFGKTATSLLAVGAVALLPVAAHAEAPALGQTGGYPVDQYQLGSTAVAVNVFNGGLVVGEDDLAPDPATYNVAYSRFYNSLAAGSTELGPRWSLSVGPDVHLMVGSSSAVLTGPSGYSVTFTRNADGTWVSPAGYDGSLKTNPDGTFAEQEPSEGQTLTFDALGQLTKTTDAAGNDFTVQTTSAAGHTILGSYGTPSGRRINLSYNGNARLIEVDDPASTHRYYDYDSQNRLSAYRGPAGTETYSYDANGYLNHIGLPDGSSATFTVLPNGQVASLTLHHSDGTPDETTSYAYANGSTTVTYADGSQQTYSFDANGQLLEDAATDQSAVDYYTDADGISAEQAEADLRTQAKAAPVDTRLISQLGDDYVGMGFDSATGRVKLHVTSSASPTRVAQALAAGGITDVTDVTTGGPNFGQLHQGKLSVQQQLQSLADAGRVRLGVDPEAGAVSIEEANNLTAAEQASVQAARDGAAVPTSVVVLDQGDLTARATACLHGLCDRPLRGGQHIDTKKDETHVSNCSAGFIARSAADRKPYVMTAGHCLVEAPSLTQTWYSAVPSEWHADAYPYYSRAIGPGHSAYFAGKGNIGGGNPDGDAALITIDSNSFWNHALAPLIVVYGTKSFDTTRDERYPILRTGTTPGDKDARQKDFVVCTSGAPVVDNVPTPAERCGKVSDVDVDPKYDEGPDPSGLAEFSTCGQFSKTGVIPGASGSPVYKNNTAYGIISGSDQDHCHGFYEGINRAKHTLGVSITFRAG